MTDTVTINIPALIAEARHEADLAESNPSRLAEPSILRDLASALESAAEQRDELASVVEKVRAWAAEREQDEWDAVERILPAISVAIATAPKTPSER